MVSKWWSRMARSGCWLPYAPAPGGPVLSTVRDAERAANLVAGDTLEPDEHHRTSRAAGPGSRSVPRPDKAGPGVPARAITAPSPTRQVPWRSTGGPSGRPIAAACSPPPVGHGQVPLDRPAPLVRSLPRRSGTTVDSVCGRAVHAIAHGCTRPGLRPLTTRSSGTCGSLAAVVAAVDQR